jgi:DNA-binding Lrp family transcriptional regulator
MDKKDKELLSIINKEFPIEQKPFERIALELGITEDEVLQRISRLKKEGIIRRIGATIDSKAIGWHATLCAAEVADDKIDAFASVVNAYNEVTHNYVRSGSPNCWFTLIAPSKKRCADIIREIEGKLGIKILELPAKRVFKIDVGFQLED